MLAQGLADQQLSLSDASMPDYVFNWSHVDCLGAQLNDEAIIRQVVGDLQRQINPDQDACFRTITQRVVDNPQGAHFYLQGPRGTGRTFLYKTIYHHFRSQRKSALCVASTGTAALLLPSGRTSHAPFKIPIDLDEASLSLMSTSSRLASELKKCRLGHLG